MTDKLIDSGPVLLDLAEDGVAHLRLNRPEASNGMNVELLRALHEAVLRCHGEPRVRAVILSGEGPHFCAGGDVRTFASKGADLPDYLREATAWLQIVVSALGQLRAPVIAEVHGFAAGGGGLGLVCAADLAVAAESARFMSGAVRVGMAPDAGVSATLTQLVGLRTAMEILLTNPTLTAARALEIGLLTRVVPDEALHEETLGLARELAAAAPLALAATKRLVWNGVGAPVGTITLEDSGGGLVLQPNLKGLPPGQHGFHLHAKASCAPGEQDGKMAAGIGAGGHFDPDTTKKHLGPDAMGGHKGDLPVLTVAADGSATGSLVAPHLKLADLAGHALMIHAGGDNYSDQPKPLGGGGARIACGVVE